MKLANVKRGDKNTFGIVTDSGFIDLGARLGGQATDIVGLFEKNLVGKARELAAGTQPDCSLDEIVFRTPNDRSDARIFALGWAYAEHQAETGKEPPAFPNMFNRLPESLVGHGAHLVKPNISDTFDYEGEVAVIIGKGGRHIPMGAAKSHIGGYSILMDGSIREWQKHSITAGKNFDKSGSFGPWVLTADEVPDPAKLILTTRLNGEQVQHAPFGDMVWDLAHLVHYISTFCELRAGDVISTGTPGGVGHKRNPQKFMKPGDTIEVEVQGLGLLRNTVVQEVED